MNTTAFTSYQHALSILNPSSKELEHGLELHRNCIVFDAYGFAPLAPVDGDKLREAIAEGASPEELTDLSEEMSMTGHIQHTNDEKEYKEMWDASGVTCVFQNSGEEGQSPLQMLKRFARQTYSADMHRGILCRASLPEDVEKAKQNGLHSVYMTANGVPLRQEWRSVEGELSFIRLFFQLGCRMMHMTYNRRNMLGDGCMETSNAGLSDFGRAAITEMNRVGVICDVAHSGLQTSVETAKFSARPVVSSHSACDALYHHQRSKSDDIIKVIADSGGYNGICCVPDFLGGAGDITSLLDHLDHMIKRFGSDHVAIGTDKICISAKAREELTKLGDSFPKARPIFESFWQPQSYTGKDDSSLAWTNWPLFTVGLVQRGHSDETIRKVIGGNVLRVARAALEGTAPCEKM